MYLVDSYLFREILKPFALITVLVAFIFATFSMARYTDDAIGGTLGTDVLFNLVALESVIALEVIIPIALFLAIVVGLGKLHSNAEIKALQAAGIGRARIYRSVLLLTVPFCILVIILSVYGRPWAYEHRYQTRAEAEAEFRLDQLQPGRFHGSTTSNRILNAGSIAPEQRKLSNVFMYQRGEDGRTEVIIADQAFEKQRDRGGEFYMQLHDGVAYRLHRPVADDEAGDRVIHYQQLDLKLETHEPEVGFKRKSAPTSELFGSDVPANQAELQWRLSRPVTALILALFAVALSWSNPFRSMAGQLLPAIGVYVVFYNLMGMARTWVEQGAVGAVPGIWWVHVLMLLIFVAVLERRNLVRAVIGYPSARETK